MEKRIYPQTIDSVASPEPFLRQSFTDAREAVEALAFDLDVLVEFEEGED